MAQTPTNDALFTLWRAVMDPHDIGMPEAIAQEVAGFTGETPEVVLEKMNTGNHDFRALWEQSRVDPSDQQRVQAFYHDQFVEAYELANWHCGRETGQPPLNYARAALLAQELGLIRVLDFGSGIGSGSLCLAHVGCEVHSADVAGQLLKFVAYRLSRRGVRPTIIDLAAGERPRQESYDLITCFDVLEHIPDQLAKLRELQSYLRIGGYLLVNLMDDSTSCDRPMHVSSAGNWLALIRRTAFRPDWKYFDGQMQAIVRTRFGRPRNYVASWIDRVRPPAAATAFPTESDRA